MDVKEAIEILEIEIKLLGEEIEICNPLDDIDAQIIPANKKFIIEYNQIIGLLQRGEAYKKMWEELDNNKYVITRFSKKGYLLESITPREWEQKYFPKEKESKDE